MVYIFTDCLPHYIQNETSLSSRLPTKLERIERKAVVVASSMRFVSSHFEANLNKKYIAEVAEWRRRLYVEILLLYCIQTFTALTDNLITYHSRNMKYGILILGRDLRETVGLSEQCSAGIQPNARIQTGGWQRRGVTIAWPQI